MAKDESVNMESLASRCRDKGVLIITDECKNARQGAGINLLTLENKVRFEIYQQGVRNGGIKLSSRLSMLAQTVYP